MPPPLTAKKIRPAEAQPSGCLFSILTVACLGALTVLAFTDTPVHVENRILNFLLHALIVLVPALSVVFSLQTPLEYEVPAGESIVEEASYIRSFATEWWMSLLLWAAPVVSVGSMVIASWEMLSGTGPAWSTTAWSALFLAALSFCLCFFYGNLLALSAPTALSDEGMRMGPSHFADWEDIHHVQEDQGIFLVYLEINPSLPFGSIRPPDRQSLDTLIRYLETHKVPGSHKNPAALGIFRGASMLGFGALVYMGFYAPNHLSIEMPWVILGVFGAGILLTLGLERIRGIHKVTKIKPRIGALHPPENQVVMRALCVAALVKRAGLEQDLRDAQAQGNERIHKAIRNLEDTINSLGLHANLSDEEKMAFSRPPGTWPVESIKNAVWRAEALGVLLWSLSLVEDIPAYDSEWDMEDYLSAADPLAAMETALEQAHFRASMEVEQARDVAELWHWRGRTSVIMAQGVQPTEGHTFQDIIAQTSRAAFESGDIPRPLEEDFPAFNTAYVHLDTLQREKAMSIAMERHFALNWLCAFSENWDDTPTDT